MTTLDLMDDLYAYNDWANQKILALCGGLTDEQLDRPRDIGFGTLRATIFHILTAEQIWLERWRSVAWREFPRDPVGMSINAMGDRLRDVAEQRRELVAASRNQRWGDRIQYADSSKNRYDHRLFDLLLHVANHGVHHRAQALNYLRHCDRTVVAGLDYIFYRLAHTTVPQTDEAIESLRAYGLAVAETPGQDAAWDAEIAARLFAYHDWANGKVLNLAADVDDASLDQPFTMGVGSIRKTLLHLRDAEQWWLRNWTIGPDSFPNSPPDTTIDTLESEWQKLAHERNEFIAKVDTNEALRVIEVLAGGPPTRFRVGESIIHLALHGTHHRAQLINMLRHVDAPVKDIDLLYAIDELPS